MIILSLEINKLLEIEREAEERIKKAREDADKIVEEAEKKAETILGEAEKKEFSEIEKEYSDKIEKDRVKIMNEYHKMADDLYSKGLKKIEIVADYIVKKILEVE